MATTTWPKQLLGSGVRRAGEVFTMTLAHDGAVRENHVVEFDEGRRIA